jgi:hypothetical protein
MIKKIGHKVLVIVSGIVGLVAGGFFGWLIGLFFHSCWWIFKGAIGNPFDFSSGLILYTSPYAILGALAGVAIAVGAVEDKDEHADN